MKLGEPYDNHEACEAAENGYSGVVHYFIQAYDENDVNNIARCAASRGYNDIVYDMIHNYGADNYYPIAQEAAKTGDENLVYDMIDNYAHEDGNWLYQIALYARRYNRQNIVNYMEEYHDIEIDENDLWGRKG